MSSRIFVERRLEDPPWCRGLELDLPPVAARHVQVLRLQPGSELTVFDGRGGQWQAQVTAMTRSGVRVALQTHEAVERELALPVTLAVCIPTNDRMDDLVEKATELGAAGIVPLMSERSVLRLSSERATRRQAHWQSVAVAASEQSGRNRVLQVQAPLNLSEFLDRGPDALIGPVTRRWQLSLSPAAQTLRAAWEHGLMGAIAGASAHLLILSGPEGGLTLEEQRRAEAAGFAPVSLGRRTLRADTAPLAALAAIGALAFAIEVGSGARP